MGRELLIQTDYQALKWLFNVKDPSSRLVKRLRLEQNSYKIEYKKGKRNTAADAFSRMYPIQHTEKTLTQTQKIGENDDEIHVQEKHDSKIVYDETKNEE